MISVTLSAVEIFWLTQCGVCGTGLNDMLCLALVGGCATGVMSILWLAQVGRCGLGVY